MKHSFKKPLKEEFDSFHLGIVQVGLWQCLGLFVQRVDEWAMALDLLVYLSLLASQSLRGELVVADLLAGHLPERLQDPRLHVVGVCLELVQGHGLFETLFSQLGGLDKG